MWLLGEIGLEHSNLIEHLFVERIGLFLTMEQDNYPKKLYQKLQNT